MEDVERCARAYVMCEIMGYLGHRPRASDTLDGIVRWWTLQQRFRIGRNTVRSALDELVARGRVVRTERRGVGVVYAAADPS